ncbi:TPA: restriction endonuclease subunit S [Photobacterium damselae]
MSVLEQEIPDGYKKTEIGVIPEDWIVEHLEYFTSFISYGFTNPMPTVFDGPPMITARDINQGKIQYSTARCTSEDAFKKLLTPKSKPKANDLLLTKDGTLGRLALVDKEDICINQSVALLRPNSKINPSFFKLLLESPYYQEKMLDDAGGSTIKHIYITIVNKMFLGLPSKRQEQIAIANALSDVDALLTELEKLIAKKQAIKTGTMQHLLTGKTRLPQFAYYAEGEKQGQLKGTKSSKLGEIPVDWDVTSIASLTRNIIDYRGRTPKKLGMDWGGGDIVALSAGNVKKGFIDFDEDCYLGSDALYKKWMKNGDVEKNDIVFTMEAPLGNIALIPDSKRYILSQRTVLLQLNREEYEPTFVYQLMMSNHFQNLLSDSATGSTAQGIKRTRFEQLLLCLPSSKEEQTAIAIILSDMDSEIQTLEQRLEKTRQIKQGMMQELLTGRTRLPFKKES